MEIELKLKYRTPKPKGTNKSQSGNGRLGEAVRLSEAALKAIREERAASRASQPEVVVRIDGRGRRHIIRTYPTEAAA